jgi:flagellar hook-length control protein FliK
MTQIFTNIASLADFLIAQKGQPKQANNNTASVTGFEDFLTGQITIDNSVMNNPEQSKLEGYPELSDFGFSVSLNPLLGFPGAVDATKLTNQDFPIISKPALIQLPNNSAPIPVESITPIKVNVGQLKQLAAEQVIPLTLRFDQASVVNNPNISFDQNKLLPNSPQFEHPSMPSLGQINWQSNQGSMAIPEPQVLNGQIFPTLSNLSALGNPAIKIPPVSPPNVSQPEKPAIISIDVGKLIRNSFEFINATVENNGNESQNVLVRVSDLTKLVNDYPENITIQIKADQTGKSPKSDARFDNREMVIRPAANNIEKSYLVNLKSLISANNTDEINVLQKIVLAKFSLPIESKNINSGITAGMENKLNVTPEATNIPGIVAPTAEIAVELSPKERRSESSKAVEISTERSRPAISKDAKQEIQPVQPGKSPENSLANILGRDQATTNSAMHNITGEKPLAGSQSSIYMARQAQQTKVLNQIRSQLLSVAGNTQLTIQLKPENLGKVKVELKLEGNKLNATFKVDNPDVKRVLDAELPNLKNDWKIDSFRVETNIRHNEDGSNSYAYKHGQAKMSDEHSSRASSQNDQSNASFGKSTDEINKSQFNKLNNRIDFFA